MFNTLKLSPSYCSNSCNIAEKFYNPVLSTSKTYDRASGYFSAKALANMAEGLAEFYFNGGKMRLIISEEVSENDYNLITDAYRNKQNYDNACESLMNKFDYDSLSEEDKNAISNIAFLIENNVLDIKIAFRTPGIFHDKFGIMEDENGNTVYFKGSNNETEAAILKNYESFDITCSWLSGEFDLRKIENAKKQFSDLWNNQTENLQVLPIPQIIKANLIKYSKGKMSVKEKLNENTILLDIVNNELVAKLGLNVNINEKNYFYKSYIKSYVNFLSKESISFNEGLTYTTYITIHDYLKKYSDDESEKGNFCVVAVSDAYDDYIRKMNYKIKERSELGIFIKEENSVKNSDIAFAFNEFCDVVNHETVRQLKDKQMWNAFHIVKMKKSANFSVPGAGKTTIVYGAYAYLTAKNLVDKLVVIGPKSSFKTWKEEFTANFGDKRPFRFCDIQSINRKELIEKSVNADVILINYESLPTLEKQLSTILKQNAMLVFDEIHKVKNPEGVRAQVALKISETPEYKVGLSGTPIPNSYLDIYNLLNILYLDEYNQFFGFKPNYLKAAGAYEEKIINDRIYPFFCRTSKKDLSVPEPDSDNIVVGLVDAKLKQLFSIVKEIYKHDPFSYYIRMMQCMTNPSLLKSAITNDMKANVFVDDIEDGSFDDSEIGQLSDKTLADDYTACKLIDEIGYTDKFIKGIDIIEELVNENKKVMVWGLFNDTLNKIYDALSNKGIKAEVINGSVSDLIEREKMIDKFLNDDVQVLISNPNTMAESVSLHKSCHDAVYFEYSFNYAHMAQSRDRINRLGLKADQYTRYNYLMTDDIDGKKSIDKIIYNRLIEKNETMINAIENGDLKSVKTNLREEILQLLDD